LVRIASHGVLVGLALMNFRDASAEWKGKGELGLVLARGNTNTETLNAKADMTKETEKWKHLVGFSMMRSTSEHELTGNRYEAHGQSNYALSEKSYALGSLRYESDEFSPYDYSAVASLGYGYKIFDTEETKLAIELGAGYRYAQDRDSLDVDGNLVARGEAHGNAIVRGGVNYEQKLTSNTLVYDKLLVESGSTNTFVQNELGIKVAMNESLALSVAHLLRYNTEVNEAIVPIPKQTDHLFTVNLVFAF
jgi:putative salt-induced outer membrane protein